MMNKHKLRRIMTVSMLLVAVAVTMQIQAIGQPFETTPNTDNTDKSRSIEGVVIKGRAPKTGYSRDQFGNGWQMIGVCDTRNSILLRDLQKPITNEDCKVISGTLNDPYTGKTIQFVRGEQTSDDVQIDHVVALSNAWQTGAQQLTFAQRVAFANDPLNLLAVDGSANEQKSDGDAATWLPQNKSFRCQYVERQTKVKRKYELWMTQSEYDAIMRIQSNCRRTAD